MILLIIGGAALHSVLSQQKAFFNDVLELTGTVERIHETYADADSWPGPTSRLTSPNAALSYKQKMERIQNVYRSSCALINLEKGLEPLREAIARITPEIDSMIKERNRQVVDYDSYRRRLKALREKQDNYEVSLIVL